MYLVIGSLVHILLIHCMKVFENDHKNVTVCFLGEDGVGNGPRREFFRLLMSALKNNNVLFDGPCDRRILQHNTSALQV